MNIFMFVFIEEKLSSNKLVLSMKIFTMARIHLFEFEDFQWFPSIIRNYMTDFLQFTANKFDFYKDLGPILKRGLDSTKSTRIIDLASGGGGGWMSLIPHVQKEIPEVNITLTDYYPNFPAFELNVKKHPDVLGFYNKSVDARDVPSELKGLRTQFLSLHHFRPDDAKKILQNAVDSGQPIAIFEAQQRTVLHFIQFFFSPINVLILTPFIKPFSVGRIFFTYLLPLVPLFTWWDGLVSVLRTYSKKELEDLVNSLENKDRFDWEIDHTNSKPAKVYYLLGTPKA